ncbi:putative MFS family arabinose efflux permease [Bosea sp. 62]|uniref:MFS transporter n=1 Tax=unclassified Bosea (in: a-proteobacteria) TaxID=2653178 RepID=UPI001258E567|nr:MULTISPECIES: MFS transporter [unclassified Bosea (in: a-proteobacteria)]CAD5291700.1 putative MFS family arabinose efflux permease [Bosea sp. 7B]CAD5299537.1 putative MFS family arabinose efflux permease [Bosea sp. 21B]CAD5299677.1 putative MFS family arabinose efflux permease [Bosea sp. 46]VVT61708.1 Predicted arabinose efflux permease, MFS family [Bosea sp. EC-HK365B]VXB04944.1 putative MFS family arabinose efflux permease [Bosea sp. 127]
MTATARRGYAPEIIVAAGCLIALISFGPRASAGLFQLPMISQFGWGRDTFSLALAIQNLLWGLGAPFAGAIADRFGMVRVLCAGALLYAAGLVTMSYASTPLQLHLGAGVLIGFGLSACSFNLILAAFGKLLPEQWRPLAFGAGTAAGSFGQFLFPPIGNILIETLGWQQALIVFAFTLLPVLPLSVMLAMRGSKQPAAAPGVVAAPNQSIAQALAEAFKHRSYVLLVLGFFTCGFQLAFITVHMPAYLKDTGLPAWVGGWTLAAIGLANAVGSLGSGWLTARMPKRHLLAWIYLGRAVAITAFILLPPSPTTAIAFGIVIGVFWLSTVPPTSALVMLMFGTKYMAMLYGFAFFSHQVGGFLGVLLGGILYEQFGSYNIVWWLSVALGVASALINLPIVEKPVARTAPQPA